MLQLNLFKGSVNELQRSAQANRSNGGEAADPPDGRGDHEGTTSSSDGGRPPVARGRVPPTPRQGEVAEQEWRVLSYLCSKALADTNADILRQALVQVRTYAERRKNRLRNARLRP